MLKVRNTTLFAFVLGAAVTAGGTSLYFDYFGPATVEKAAAPPELFPKAPEPMPLPKQVPSAAPAETGLADVSTMINRLAERLEGNPNNPDGWRMLGWSYLSTGQAEEAAKAYAKAIKLKGDVAEYHSGYGEALVKQADGTVTPSAKGAFDAALTIDSGDARARYFSGLAKRQGGDARGAFDIWAALLKDTPPNASFLKELRTHMASLSQELGMAGQNGTARTSPAAAMAPKQNERIRGMVEGLAQRLKEEPDDPKGWRMLGKSYGVLGNYMGSVEAYAKLVTLRPDDASARRQHAEAILKTVPPGEPYPASLTETLNWLYQSDPKDEFALFHLGEASSRTGNKEMATKLWHELLEILPKNSPLRATIGSRLRTLTETKTR